MSYEVGEIILVLLFFALVLTSIFILLKLINRKESRAEVLLHRWIQREGLELLSCERPFLYRFRTRRAGLGEESPTFFRIIVRFPSGKVRNGILRCGGHTLGSPPLETLITWDRPKKEPQGFPVILPEAPEEENVKNQKPSDGES